MVKEWRKAPFLKRLRLGVIVVVTALVGFGMSLREPLAFDLGFFAGATSCFWLGLREMAVPAYIDKWRQGAEGEKWTAKELRKLPDGWRVRHDLQSRYGNVDHIVVGPAGLFLLDTKCWQNGTTTITSSGPVVAARHDPDLTGLDEDSRADAWRRGGGKRRRAQIDGTASTRSTGGSHLGRLSRARPRASRRDLHSGRTPTQLAFRAPTPTLRRGRRRPRSDLLTTAA
jgi:hypothetical protein